MPSSSRHPARRSPRHDADRARARPGIAPAAKILPIGIGLPYATPASVSAAIHWAVDHGAKVLSMSFGGRDATGERYRPAETEAIKYAFDHDVVVVAAAGNTTGEGGVLRDDSDVDIPADMPGDGP
jgi:subtilisin family serine protease